MKSLLLSFSLILTSTLLAQGPPPKQPEVKSEVNKQESLNEAVKHLALAAKARGKAQESLSLVCNDLYLSSENIWREGISDLIVAYKELDSCNEKLVSVLLGTDWDSKSLKLKEIAIISDHLFVESTEVFSKASQIYGSKCIDNPNPVERKRAISSVSEALLFCVSNKIESVRLKAKIISIIHPELKIPSTNPMVANP